MNAPKKASAKYRKLSAVIRVSRVNGREGDSYHAPAMQREAITAWATAHGVEIVSWHREEDWSGKTTNRPGLNEAMDEALSGKSDGIIVAKVDRFSRNLGEGLKAVRKLDKAGKAFVSVEDGIDGLNPKSFGNRILLMWLLFMAEWYLETITDNWERVRERQIEAGIANSAPYGYEKGPDKRLVPFEPEARWVRLIFKWRAKGESLRAIAAKLNEQEAPSRGAEMWTAVSVSRVLNNRTYLGELWSGQHRGKVTQFDEDGDPVEPLKPHCKIGAHKPLVTRKQWDAINRNVRPGRQATYPLSGILRCASCGGPMRGNTDHYTPQRYNVTEAYSRRTYRCHGEHSWGTCPRPARILADDVEAYVYGEFDRVYLTGRAFVGVQTGNSEALAAAQETVDRIEGEMDDLATNPTFLRMRENHPERYLVQLDETMDRLDAAKAVVREHEAEALGWELPEGIVDLWPTMDDSERRAVIELAFPVIAVAPLNGARRGSIPPVSQRVRLFPSYDDDMPTDLPGRGGGGNQLRPISLNGTPA